ncbi:MAG: GntR family transcriptional regulator [Actinomycetota bacterium]|jgi:GntR family transcriptional regulator|nr:GntR family transcriptional regulator [Actinomycetota bacterium]
MATQTSPETSKKQQRPRAPRETGTKRASDIVGTSAWWTENDDRDLVVQVTHLVGVKLAERSVLESGSEVRIELALSPDKTVMQPGDGVNAVLSTLNIALRHRMAGRRLAMLADNEPKQIVRVSKSEKATFVPIQSQGAEPPAVQRADGPVRAGIPEDGRVPRYYQAKGLLQELARELGEGAAIPSERELAERFGMARMTLRQAIGELVLEGKLRRRHGSGTYVAPPKAVLTLTDPGIATAPDEPHVVPGRKLVTLEELPADASVAAELGIGAGDPVVHLEQIQLIGETAMSLESTYLSAKRFPALLRSYHPANSLHAQLHDEFDVTFAEAEERVETVLATPREAGLLGTILAQPMLLLHRVSYDDTGKPIERVRALIRGDRYTLAIGRHLA